MNILLRLALSFTLSILLAAPARASITIGSLAQLCGYDASGRELAPSAHASCQSYIAGIVDYQELFKSVGKTSASIDFCLPDSLTYTDIQRVVLEYLQKHGSYENSPAAAAVVISLHNEYPCADEIPVGDITETGPVDMSAPLPTGLSLEGIEESIVP